MEPKPCPFCGKTEFLLFDYQYRKPGLKGCYIKCENCKASGGMYETLEQAVEAWNMRKDELKHDGS